MKNLNKILKTISLAFLFFGIISYAQIAKAQITNPGFETGDLTGWSGSGTISPVATVLNWTISPSGTYMATMVPGGYANATVAETELLLTSGSLTSAITGSTNIGLIYQDVSLTSGQEITMWWNYVSEDYAPFDDGSFATLSGAGGQQIQILVRTVSDVGLIPPTGSYGSSDWHTVTFISPGTGTYRLGFGCFNFDDTGVPPHLYIDNEAGGTSAPGAPIVTTTAVSSILTTTASSGGNVTNDGGSTITARGVCWSTSSLPTTANNKTSDGTGTGTFTSSITGLTAGTTYYVRAYATNSTGTSYGGEQTFTTLKLNQTITFGPLADKTYGDADFAPGATASSGLDVTYSSSNTAVATIVGGMIHIVGVGSSTITASQDGDATYNAATPVQQTLTVTKANQTITFDALPYIVLDDADFAPGATASSGLTVSYTSSNTAVATIVGDMIHIVGIGSSTITASQAGDANYNAAISVQQTLTVHYASPVLTCSSGNNELIINATAIIIDPALTVTGTQDITGARVSIGSFQSGDVLAWDAGSLPSGVTGNFNTTIGVLTFSGTATAAQWQTLLRTVTIATTSSVTTQRVSTFALGSSLPLDTNGHYYEFITSSGITWTNANTAANSKNLFGLQGYLATITSAAENDFISSKLGGNGWIGASDAAVEGTWRWITGPEGLEAGGAGRNFYTGIYPTGAAVSGNYTHWYSGEPNNASNEDYAHFYASGTQKGFWNDFAVNNASIAGYCVEYGGMVGDPTLQISSTKALDVKLNQTITFAAIANKTYGNADFASGATASSGLTVTLVSSDPTVATVSGLNIHIVKTGSCTITASQAGDGTYMPATSVAQNLTINKAGLTITAEDKTKVYDGEVYSPFTVTYNGLITGETATNLGGTLAYGGTASTAVNVGTNYVITPSGLTSDNYDITFVAGKLDITKKALTVTADDQTKVYDGGIFSPFTVTYNGFVTGESASNLAGTLAYSGTATTATNVGTNYVITPSGQSSDNYNITFVAGKLDITKKAIAITADAKTKVYGEADPALTYQITIGSLVTGDAFSGSLTRAVGENVADYAIAIGTVSAGANYDLSFVSADLSITQKAITIAANAKTKVYGEADPALTYQITSGALESGDVFSGSLTRAAGENVADYAIAIGTVSAGANYDLSFVSADLSITQKAITISADAKTKIYGEADPVLTYQITVGTIETGDVFSGSLTRAAGENIGDYAISSTLANTNYSITFVSDNLSITEKAITITADAKTKVYGEVDPALTYQITVGSLVTGDALSGSLTRAAGENVGDYAISSTLANSNYSITFVSDNLSITEKAITITADAKTKVYGEIDPALTYQITSGALVSGDAFSGSLTRAPGENVADYAIAIGTVSAGANYNLSFVSADLSITQKAITIAADAKTKVYGEPDPALTYQITSGALESGDVFSGSLTRAVGENVADYAIAIGTVSAGANYDLSFVSADLSITQKAITITADAKTKVYGEIDPALTYQFTLGALETGDVLSGSLTRAAGENVGDYAISSTLANTNYSITFVSDNLSITEKAITITADAKTKVYGEIDPALTYQFTVGSLVTGDALSGSLTRAVGENVGDYAISSTLANTNYSITFISDNLSITEKAITITADARTKVYGEIDPALTYQFTVGSLMTGDALSGSLTRAAGENVGDYAISSTLANSNYSITFVSDNLSITEKAITITADAKTKVYGEIDPALTYQITVGSLVTGDTLSGSLTRVAGENVGDYAINSTLANTNYSISFVSDNLSITEKAIAITADAKTKVYGEADPALTYQITSGALVSGDTFSGSLTRAVGENVADYAIAIGTVSVGANYDLSFIPADLSITQKAISITADAKSKIYGEADPALTYQITVGALESGDDFSGSLTRAVGENVADYAIEIGTVSAGANYDLSFVSADLSITQKAISITDPTIASKIYDASSDASSVSTIGSVSGILEGDDVTVLIATSVYDSKDVGTEKTVTVTYSLIGADIANYSAPQKSVLSTGEITTKQLDITGPTVTINKMYDGTTSADIIETGALIGVESSDIVNALAIATYNDANIGTDKTITVAYSLNGDDAANYIAPENDLITGAKISEEVILSDEIIVPLSGSCQDDLLYVVYNISSGTPIEYQILFDEAAIAAGFQNISYTALPSTAGSDTLFVQVPGNMKEGSYQAQLQLRNELEFESAAQSFTFIINLNKAYVVPKFNDVVLFDNSSNRFNSYQWYKDGEAISGATGQFYNDPEGLIGSYYVNVGTINGENMRTCAQRFDLSMLQSVRLSVYPNPVRSKESFTLKISNLSLEELQGSRMYIYAANGVLIYQTDKVENINQLQLPVGEYVGTVNTNDGRSFTYKVMVTQ